MQFKKKFVYLQKKGYIDFFNALLYLLLDEIAIMTKVYYIDTKKGLFKL